MRKLNNKNKLYILLFSIIICGIIGILVYAVSLSSGKLTSVYEVSNNSVIFDSNTNLLDTKKGGEIAKSWDNQYYYQNEDNKYDIGKESVVFEKLSNEVIIFGENHQVGQDGTITKNKDKTTINNLNISSFYKLSDRKYLIVSNEIYETEKTIYANKYLIVYIDKQGNASVLNDVINIKTINPIQIKFNEYTFDVANEKLIIGKNTIDLKAINGSTNEYSIENEKPKYEGFDAPSFIEEYNKLVNNFNQYKNNSTINVGGNNQVTNNNFVTNGNSSSSSNATSANNSTNINKRVSLRGAVTYTTYIDVSYVVTDPEEKYQAVYLLVTGVRKGEMYTEKVILDKYETKHRVENLDPRSEYSISLGYVEVTYVDGEKTLTDFVEDVINVRTTKSNAFIEINKIYLGKVDFKFKMSKTYALESGRIVLLADGEEVDSIYINTTEALSENGFNASLNLTDTDMFELKLIDAMYNGNTVTLDVNKKFVYQFLN